MANPKIFTIKESEKQIKRLLKSSSPMLCTRLKALLVFKQYEATGIPKRVASLLVGVDQNSIQTWRSAYITGGIDLMLSHKNTGYKPSKISTEQEAALAIKLSNPNNGIVGFVELLDWFNTTYNVDINYKTFHGFIVRKFQAKIKVARKVHIKKDETAVAAFKKTSVKSAKK